VCRDAESLGLARTVLGILRFEWRLRPVNCGMGGMDASQPMFSDTIPADYDRYLGPFLFEYYARDLAQRLGLSAGNRVLETACGTGIATEHLRQSTEADLEIVATDLSEPMLQHARGRRGHLKGVRFEHADAAALLFGDSSFDALAQQFGLMFMGNKLASLREANRVLRPGGRIVFSVWDDLASNPFVQVAQDTIATFFWEDPPQFLYLPWSCHSHGALRKLMAEASFEHVELHTLPHVSKGQSAHAVASGLVCGNPTINDVRQRASASVEDVVAAVAAALSKAFGADQLRVPMRAIVVTAMKSLS
jgi:ubiquinone/menaquinone biosynthesis C-methylase UbiE